MEKEIKKFEKACDGLIMGLFETIILPKLRKEAIKIGVDKISECNNCWFFKIKGKEYIEREFCELGSKYDSFFQNNIRPIDGARYLYPKNINFFIAPKY